MQKRNRIEKSSFFNEISLEYKATKLPQDYMEREESQISPTEGLKGNSLITKAHRFDRMLKDRFPLEKRSLLIFLIEKKSYNFHCFK